MANKGIVRKIDELGRLVIPIEMRRVLDISEHDDIEICLDPNENAIVLEKYVEGDIFTGSQIDLVNYKGKKVSLESIIELAKLAQLIEGDVFAGLQIDLVDYKDKKIFRKSVANKGIVRKIDELGRLVIPIEMRRVLDISEHDDIEICLDPNENAIVLKKYVEGDIFTGSRIDLVDYKGKKISRESIIELAKLINLI